MEELVTFSSRSCDILTFYLIALEQHLSFGAMLVFEKINKSLSSSHIFRVRHLPCGNQNQIKISAWLPIELLEKVASWFCIPAFHRLTHPVTTLEHHSLDTVPRLRTYQSTCLHLGDQVQRKRGS